MSWNDLPNETCVIDTLAARPNDCQSGWALLRLRGSMFWAAMLMLGILAGCGAGHDTEARGTVTGKVTVKGKPLTTGRVNFISNTIGTGAGGDLKPDGTYALDGPVPLGNYNVFITFDIPPSQRGTAAENVLKSVPEKYQTQATSDLTAEVNGDVNEQDFDLK